MKRILFVASALALSVACGDSGPAAPTCDLTVDNLTGKSFVMSEAQPKGPPTENPLARMTFVDEGGLKVKYTAMSVSDIYTYSCEKKTEEGKDDQLLCAEKDRVQDWCEALLARDKACTRKKLKKLGASGTDEELATTIKAAKAAKAKVEKEGTDRDKLIWRARRASLGNKLQGTLYAKVDSKCRLRIDDLYWTLTKDGEKIEDTNPAGTNPFVKSDQPWFFGHCTNTAALWDLPTDAFPKEALGEAPKHEMGKPIYYYNTAEQDSKPSEGCTYSYNTYAGWLPDQKDLTPKVEEGRLLWRGEHTFTEKDVRSVNGKTGGLYAMERFKTCGGKKELIDISCRPTVFP